MKALLISLALILTATQVFGQRKSKEEPAPPNATVDSLTLVNKKLAAQLDSVSGELVKYVGVYNAIKEKVLHYNFDPTRSAFLIDSLQALRDSTSALLTKAPPVVPNDSLVLLVKENRLLKATVDSVKAELQRRLSALTEEEIQKARAIGNLKQLKELLDAKIISETEYITLKKKYIEKL